MLRTVERDIKGGIDAGKERLMNRGKKGGGMEEERKDGKEKESDGRRERQEEVL